jgi:hypothetical protein
VKRLLSLTAASAALLAACGDRDRTADQPADLAPADAALYGEVAVRPTGQQRRALEAIAARFLDGREVGPTVTGLVDRFLRESTDKGRVATYREDIRPWLGERAAGFMIDFDPEEGAVMIEATDEDAAQRFVETGAEADDLNETDKSYEGVDYIVDEVGTAAGVVEGHVVIGTERGLRETVDALYGDSLAESDTFADAVEDGGGEQALAYLYAPPARIIEVATERDQENAEQLAAFVRALGVDPESPYLATLGLHNGSLRLDQRATLDERSDGGDPERMLEQLPEGSWLRLRWPDAGRWIGPGLVAFFRLGAAQRGQEETVAEQLANLQEYGLHFDDLGLGDLVLFARGSDPTSFEAGVVADVEDRQEAEETGNFLVRGLLSDFDVRKLPPLPGAPEGALVGDGALPQPLVVALTEERFVVALGLGAARAALEPPSTGPAPELTVAREALGDTDLDAVLDLGRLLSLIDSFRTVPDFGLTEARRLLEPLGPVALGTRRDGDTLILRLAAGTD